MNYSNYSLFAPHTKGSNRAQFLRAASRRFIARVRDLGITRRSTSRALCLLLIISMLSTSSPAALRVLTGLVSEWNTSAAFWLRSSGWEATLTGMVTGQEKPSRKAQEKQSERNARVSRIQIYPGDVKLQVGERVFLSAVAYNKDDVPVGGVGFTWQAHEEASGRATRVSRSGEFVATIAGSFKITVESEGKKAHVTVRVEGGEAGEEGKRRKGTVQPISVRKVSTRDPVTAGAVSFNKGDDKDQFTRHARRTRSAVAAMPLPVEADWNDGNYGSADEPDNQVGNPIGGASDGGAGSGNFQFSAPVLSLPGRGIDLALGLAYNSRLWNKANSEITYDIDRGWPAPGWTLGFSKVLGQGVYNGSMIVEADGTRHPYNGNVTTWPSGNGTTFVGHTTDGSFIDYRHETGIGGAMTYAQAKYPDGTVIEYAARGAGHMYPSRITDANGNFITITYVNNTAPQIQTITDTLGRLVNFHYDANNLLTAITAPPITDPNSNPDPNPQQRVLVRINYRQLNLNYGFSGLTPRVREAAPWVINAIYYPATGTGYWFGDQDSYSSYGMIAKVVGQRGMSFSASSLNEQGTITPGNMTRQQGYSYPLEPDYTLTDAPTYQSLTELWTRDGANVDQAVTNFLVEQNASPRKVTITLPNRTKSIQYSYNYSNLSETDPLKALDGVVYQDETRDENDNLLQSSTSMWEPGAYGSPRPTRINITDERGQTTATDFSYEGGSYNQVIKSREYDYGGQSLLRETRTQYENGASYTSRHNFNLQKMVEVYAGDGVTRVSRTEYQYDGEDLTDAPGVIMHNYESNPYAPTYTRPGECYIVCDDFCRQVCDSEIQWSEYNSATNYRGNITLIKSYADAANLSEATASIETRSYDMTGNMVTTSISSGEQKSFGYTAATQYAYPTSQTSGSATDTALQVRTSATYDFNTGLSLSATDANERTSQAVYFTESLRPKKTYLPSRAANASGYATYEYDDDAMSVIETTYTSDNAIANQHVKILDGRGQVRQEKALGANGAWDIVENRYDVMGRVTQQTRPYRAGEQPQWNVTVYDTLGRVKSVEAPDGSISQTFYNEVNRPGTATSAPGQTTRAVDAWGRERWGRVDAAGRLVEVVEPDPLGDGSVSTGGLLTTYSYDTLGNLTGVTQGSQTRYFRYDSLGRLTHQKLSEASATLNDVGQYVGAGTWSEVFTYDQRSNLASRTDARGIKTKYNYNADPLNRLQSVEYDMAGFGDTNNPVLPAAAVTYGYSTTGDVTRLSTVTTAGVSTETYEYDYESRAYINTLTLNARQNYPLVTEYSYDSLDRVTDVRYPAEYGVPGAPRKVIHHDYDTASRLSGLKVNGADYATQVTYNAGSQSTMLKVGTSGVNQVTESYSYNPQTGLLENQKVLRGTGATALLDLSYDYAGANGKRTGQLTKITNNLDASQNHDRSYSYDALGRLKQAKGGPENGSLWTQSYEYDRYGNRTSVTATGNVASLDAPDTSAGAESNTQLASNLNIPTTESVREDAMRGVSDSPFTPFTSASNSSRTSSMASLPAPQPSSSIVISQVYGGGGNTGATYKNDFIELFNRGTATVDLSGWSVQYAAAGSSAWQMTQLSGSIAPGQYYLVQEAQGAGGTLNLPTPNVTDNIELNASAGKVALVNNSTPLSAACPLSASGVVDFAGYGSSAGCFEGVAAAPSPSNTNAILRASQGCIETDNNVTDFEAGAPNPRNTGSPTVTCGAASGSTTVVISEFRTRGTAGGNDEFIELYNKTNQAINIGGWKIKVSNNAAAVSTRVVITANTMLPAHGHFLAATTGTGSYSGTVTADQTYSTGVSDDGGIAITKADDTIVDQVGMSSGSAFKENRSLSPLTTNVDRSYERRAGGASGSTQDTNDSPSDFQLHTPSDPQNLQSALTPQAPVNQPPVANTGGPYSQTAGTAVDFNGSNSTDADGTITSYQWDFGDNTTGTGATPQHTYATAATYAARLTVTDNQGAQASATVNVTITTGSVAVGCGSAQSIPVEQFVTNFYLGALNRQPTAAQLQSWSDLLRQNYYQGQAQLLQAAQYMGRQIFTSAEYINRQRADRDYVYDLYKAYLQREPEQAGWDHWTQELTVSSRDAVRQGFDLSLEFSQKVATLCPQGTGGGSVPTDGLANLGYDAQTNRITTSGFSYDAAGNQTRVVRAGGGSQRYQYDAANRLVRVRDDANNLLASYSYGSSNQRLISEESNLRTYYVWGGSAVIAEFNEANSTGVVGWSKNYIYIGGRLLATQQPGANGTESVQYYHPDRLGTRLITNAQDTNVQEQVALPYGVALDTESSGATNRRFTSYDRSNITGLDYAVNRHYDSNQGRFTQVDPIGMKSIKLQDPQTLNLYAYCTGDPINHTDPDGLGFFSFFKKLFKAIGKVFSAVGNAIAKVLNNRWVRLGVFIASFLVPFLSPAVGAIIKTAIKIYNTIADIAAQLQLYGQLLQGRFKELAINVGMGIVGSYIGMVEDAVVAGIQLGIKLDGLSLSSIMKGASLGLKGGLSRLSANLIGRSLKDMFIPAYGLFGGPGNPPNTDEGKELVFDPDITGVDDMDYQYKLHDQKYRDPMKTRRSIRDADFTLVKGLMRAAPRVRIIDIAFGNRPAVGSVFKFFALNFFTGSTVVRSVDLAIRP